MSTLFANFKQFVVLNTLESSNFSLARMDVLLQNGNINTIQRASDLLMSVSVCAETHKEKIIRKSLAASEELKQMAQEREPLWVFDLDRSFEVLNFTEYNRRFSSLDPTLEEIIRVITIGGGPEELPNFNENVEIIQTESGSTQPCESEASRAIGVVSSNPVSLVNMFMDVVSLLSFLFFFSCI